MENFTPASGLAGGVLIGLAAVLLLVLTGRIAGISGIVSNAVHFKNHAALRWIFIFGLIGGAQLQQMFSANELPVREMAWPLLLISGLIVGFGTRLGGGCTSGHGVCGIGRLSRRSIVATIVFMLVAIISVFVTRHILGWST
ncbi:MAG: YeeE/YedE family protein [Gammaproteobacteria bacterium]|nr:YeeE/YedE family protein [Gammaproteobacteria bacterium]